MTKAGKAGYRTGPGLIRAYPELIEGECGVVGKERRQLVQAHKDHKGYRVALGSQGDQACPPGSHDAPVGQQRLSTQHHL